MASIAQSAPIPQADGQLVKIIPNSSFLAAFEYDQTNLTLTTTLKNGAIYQHKMFLPTNWEMLKTAQDHSKHWSDNIRGKHLSVRLRSAKAPRADLKRKGRK